MEERFINTVLEETQALLRFGGNVNCYEENLSRLSKLVSSTGPRGSTRDDLTEHSFLHLSIEILSDIFGPELTSEKEMELYTRNVRGLVLLVRNLSVEVSSYFDLEKMSLSMRKFLEAADSTTPFYAFCFEAYLQVFANFLIKQGKGSKIDHLDSLLETINDSAVRFIEASGTPDLRHPFNIILQYVLYNHEANQSILKSAEMPHFVDYITLQGLDSLKDTSFGSELLPLLQALITRNNFGFWLQRQKQKENFELVLNLCQLIATSKDEWNTAESLNIISWGYELCTELTESSIKLLNSENDVDAEISLIHSRLVRVLDIMTHLSNNQAVLKYLTENQCVETLIALFRATHENTEVETPKSKKQAQVSHSDPTKAPKKKFPLVKSLIIEILAFLCHQCHTNQEKMRKLHGLELVLSSCVIDENNPYIKEHSILCLRFVLQDNQENQKFVASLEAKQVVDGDALTEAGYEVSIEDGKVKLKNSARGD